VTGLYTVAKSLLALGEPGTHPAGAIVGAHSEAGTDVAASGWAVLPNPGDNSGNNSGNESGNEGRNRTPGVPMSSDTLLDLASVTKVASTTALAMRLVADGELDLDDRVAKHLPDFDRAEADGVTVEDLLTHSAGLQPWRPLYCETLDRGTALEITQRLPLATAPRSGRHYSDLGLMLAGLVVERVTGLGLADAYSQLVAEPLGLTSSGYGPVDPDRAAASADNDGVEFDMVRRGRPYDVPFTTDDFPGWRESTVRGSANDGNTAHALSGVSGHAGLFSTVGDLLRFGSALSRGDFVPRAVFERFARPSTIDENQAVGFRLRTLLVGDEHIPLLWHTGFTGTVIAVALDRELVIAGGATRLHGVLAPIGSDQLTRTGDALVSTDEIADVLLRGAAEANTAPQASHFAARAYAAKEER
jgi:serine-type D-Ala-D-Ala carboxypeptidase